MAQKAKLFDIVVHPQVKSTLLAIAIVGAGAAGWFSYRWYTAYKGQQAQKILSDCLQEYDKAVDGDTDWSEVASMNDLGYKQASGTALRPYFLVMQAQALARQQKVTEALEVMDRALGMLPAHSDYASLFDITRVLIQFDATGDQSKEQALQQLQAIADDQKNIYRDTAWYHIGEWYWSQDQLVQAKEAWQQLVDNKELFADSPWVFMAEQKLEGL